MSNISYYSYDPDYGYELHSTKEDAVAAAESAISRYRDYAVDGWCDNVDLVEWGEIITLAQAARTNVHLPTEDDSDEKGHMAFKNNWECWCDYDLVDTDNFSYAELQTREEQACDYLRILASNVGNGGFNAPDPINLEQFYYKVSEGIHFILDCETKRRIVAEDKVTELEKRITELEAQLASMVVSPQHG